MRRDDTDTFTRVELAWTDLNGDLQAIHGFTKAQLGVRLILRQKKHVCGWIHFTIPKAECYDFDEETNDQNGLLELTPSVSNFSQQMV